MTITRNELIEWGEAHIIALARIAGSPQGEPRPDAIHVRISANDCRVNAPFGYCCGHDCDEGDATWNALDAAASGWSPVCSLCLPTQIATGEAILDRRSAHETLAYMLGGTAGVEAYLSYFDLKGEHYVGVLGHVEFAKLCERERAERSKLMSAELMASAEQYPGTGDC